MTARKVGSDDVVPNIPKHRHTDDMIKDNPDIEENVSLLTSSLDEADASDSINGEVELCAIK